MQFRVGALQLVAMSWMGVLGSTAAIAAGVTAEKPIEQIIIVDVRTAAEFAGNHLVGAVNLDFKAADFSEQVQKLDKSGSYRLYCRTGNRSAQAVELMQKLGFGDVKNVGGLQDAAATLQVPCTAQQGC